MPDPAASLEARFSEGPPRRLKAAARQVGRPSRLAAEVEFALGLAAHWQGVVWEGVRAPGDSGLGRPSVPWVGACYPHSGGEEMWAAPLACEKRGTDGGPVVNVDAGVIQRPVASDWDVGGVGEGIVGVGGGSG